MRISWDVDKGKYLFHDDDGTITEFREWPEALDVYNRKQNEKYRQFKGQKVYQGNGIIDDRS